MLRVMAFVVALTKIWILFFCHPFFSLKKKSGKDGGTRPPPPSPQCSCYVGLFGSFNWPHTTLIKSLKFKFKARFNGS
jgi:hypothetical protein